MSVVDEVRQRIDIVDVISESVQLKKAGRNLQGLCPFHAEKTPSFVVSPERQTWHCFGACGTGGDVFSFLMRKENIEFGEALRLLARRAGVTLAPPSPQQKAADDRHERLYLAAEAAAQFYQTSLLRSASAAGARAYLDKRGLNDKTIEDFQLGFNPAGGIGLGAYLMERGYTRAELLAAGVVSEAEGGQLRDRFPGRLIFPIRNVQGRVCGFGARALDPDSSGPKYINTSQTEIFDKGGILYGLDRAKVSIRKLNQAIIVEGYMDALMAHQYGHTQVVASMGTSLTEKQVGLLKRYSKNIILALDADAAGTEATLRAHEAVDRAREEKVVPLITPGGIVRYEAVLDAEIRVLVPPDGLDPDEVIRRDSAGWQRLVDNAHPLVDFILDAVSSRYDLSQAQGKSQAAQDMLPFIAEIKDPIRQAHYLQRLASRLGIGEAVLAQNLTRMRDRDRDRDRGRDRDRAVAISQESRAEQYCLALLIQCPELRDIGQGVCLDYFESSQCREIFRSWLETAEEGDLDGIVDPALLPLLKSLREWPLPPAPADKRELELSRAATRLKEMAIRRSWRAKEGAALAVDQLEEDIETAKEMQEIFRQRQHRAKHGE